MPGQAPLPQAASSGPGRTTESGVYQRWRIPGPQDRDFPCACRGLEELLALLCPLLYMSREAVPRVGNQMSPCELCHHVTMRRNERLSTQDTQCWRGQGTPQSQSCGEKPQPGERSSVTPTLTESLVTNRQEASLLRQPLAHNQKLLMTHGGAYVCVHMCPCVCMCPCVHMCCACV